MRKLLILLTAISIVGTSASSLVSCGTVSFSGKDGQKVIVMSDSGPKTDKSFNQSSYEGMLDWAKDKTDGSEDYTKNFIQPSSADPASFKTALKQVKRYNANAAILSGGNFADVIDDANAAMSDNNKAIWVDADPSFTTGLKNIIGIKFTSEVAGLKAGFAAADYEINNSKSDDVIKFGTYGGNNIKYGVTDYMWGYIIGAAYAGVVDKHAISVYCGTTDNISKDYVSIDADGTVSAGGNIEAYTGNFAQGTSESGLYATAYSMGSDVNFVVAGPQVEDLLKAKSLVIGVDVDQVESYLDYKNQFLLSATKQIKTAISTTLSNIECLNDKDGNAGAGLANVPGYHADTQIIQNSDWSSYIAGGNNVISTDAADASIDKLNIDDAKWVDIITEYDKAVDAADADDKGFVDLQSAANVINNILKSS